MIKTLVAAAVVVGIIVFIRRFNEYDGERKHVNDDDPVYELDDILTEVFGDCMEAWCEDCGAVLATGTGPYKTQVSNVAYTHGSIYDHEVRVRSWAE